jgi:hypothetical protein
VAKDVSPQFNTPYENIIGLFSYLGKIVFPVNLSVMPIPADSQPAWGLATYSLSWWGGYTERDISFSGPSGS